MRRITSVLRPPWRMRLCAGRARLNITAISPPLRAAIMEETPRRLAGRGQCTRSIAMKLSRRELGIGTGAAALATAYGRPGWAQSPIVIKYSHVVANDTPKGKGSLRFK